MPGRAADQELAGAAGIVPNDGDAAAKQDVGAGAGRPVRGRGRQRLARLGLEPSAGDGLLEERVVALVAVGIGHRERGDGPVEGIALAEVGGDGDGVAGAGVGPGRVQPHIWA